MATYATDLNVVDAADSNSNWSELSGHTSGGAPSADTENYLQNSISVSQTTGQASGTNAGMEVDYGSDLGSGWTSGDVFMMWQYYTAPTNINSWANGGMRIGIGSSSGNMSYWNAMGDDFGGSPYACWQNTAIDPETTPDGTDDGTPTSGVYQIIGSLPNVRAKITKGAPHACDIVRYGRGEIYATGTGGTFAGYAAANDAATARWGLFQAVQGGYLWKGLFSFGQSATSLTFSDSNVNIFVDDTPKVASSFNKMQIPNSSTSVTWVGVNITGVGTSITGSAPVSPGAFDNASSGVVDWTNCTFTDLGTFVFDETTSANDLDTCTWRRCGLVTQGGARFDDCIFDEPSGTVGLLVDGLNDIEGCTFNSDGTGHGVNLGTIGSTQSLDWKNFESGYTDSSSGNETILVSVSSGFTLTINVATGASTPSVYNTGSGTVSVVANAVTTLVTAKDSISKAAIQYVTVTIKAATTGPLPFEDSVTISQTSGTATVAHTAHGFSTGQKVEIAGANENNYNRIKTITVTGVDAYTYPIDSGTASPATGTITATAIVIDGLTDVNGQISDSRTIGTDQDITGLVQKGSTPPVYKPQNIATTIDSSNGVSISLLLIAD